MRWFQLHTKVKAALAGAALIAGTDIAAQVTNHYPKSPVWTAAQLFLPVLFGYLKRESQDA